MNLQSKISVLMLAASLSSGMAMAQDISIEEAQKAAAVASAEKDTLPDDAIIVRRIPLESGPELNTDQLVVDTIPSSSEGLKIVLFNDNTWRYIRNRDISAIDETVFTQDWDTVNLRVYKTELKDLPISMVIDLVDSLKSYHYPYKGRITSKYGPRRRRVHQGTDIGLKIGDPIYATFDGRVRITKYYRGGYGNLIVLRHDNGLETYYGHLSEILVKPEQWVTAGQVIGYGGNTGRSTGPHLHFEMRYKGQSFDSERLIDFSTGTLRRETFLLKRTYFSPYSRFTQDFEMEIQSEEEDKKIAAEAAARKYHIVKKGDTLGRIAINNHTTVTKLCQLNGIKKTSVLSIGQRIRVR
ncbi:MAG: peptidoglycan DD-metalloendopeptidase family protein [Alistipes sp.]|nr:peptidoglycan DD-metalloendopeptidase family protein [Alistipes sp.]